MSAIESLFPRLRGAAYKITSPTDDCYNCIAWAVESTDRWWWPGDPSLTFWPEGVARLETVDAFCAAFAMVGFTRCISAEPEPGMQKIAVFVDADGVPTHASRQLVNGRWTSKLGRREDLEHELHDLEGEEYGTVVQILKRPLRPD